MIKKFNKLAKVYTKFVCTTQWYCRKCNTSFHGSNPPRYSASCKHEWEPRN